MNPNSYSLHPLEGSSWLSALPTQRLLASPISGFENLFSTSQATVYDQMLSDIEGLPFPIQSCFPSLHPRIYSLLSETSPLTT